MNNNNVGSSALNCTRKLVHTLHMAENEEFMCHVYLNNVREWLYNNNVGNSALGCTDKLVPSLHTAEEEKFICLVYEANVWAWLWW